MHRKLFIGILVALAMLSPAAALADGDIYVGGPYGTKITSVPYTISAPGSYYLGGNLSYAGYSPGISITADNVTLDLMGFTLSGIGETVVYGIYINGCKNVEIRNGTVSGWGYGIFEASTSGLAHRIFNIRFEDYLAGVYLFGSGHLVQGCQATGVSSISSGIAFMINQGTVSDCMAKNFSGSGIWTASVIRGSIISGNVITNASAGNGIATNAPSLIVNNAVADCATGIWANGGSLIGNTVNTTGSGQTGISAIHSDICPTLMDQNTVTGPGTRYNWGSGAVAWRNNAGYP